GAAAPRPHDRRGLPAISDPDVRLRLSARALDLEYARHRSGDRSAPVPEARAPAARSLGTPPVAQADRLSPTMQCSAVQDSGGGARLGLPDRAEHAAPRRSVSPPGVDPPGRGRLRVVLSQVLLRRDRGGLGELRTGAGRVRGRAAPSAAPAPCGAGGVPLLPHVEVPEGRRGGIAKRAYSGAPVMV